MYRTKEQKINQEAEMYKLGYNAANDAVGIKNWPRVGKPYSREWYRCKNAWQHGYKCFYLSADQKINPIESVENVPPYRPDAPERDQLAAQLVIAIIKTPRISLRALTRQFSSRHRQLIIDIVSDWYDRDILNLEYKGKKTSPTRLLGFREIPVIESYQSAQPGNSPASPPLETTEYRTDDNDAGWSNTQDVIESDKRENQYAASGCMMSDPRTQKALEGLFNPEPPFSVEPSGLAPEVTGLPENFPDYTDSDAHADAIRNGDRRIETEETE